MRRAPMPAVLALLAATLSTPLPARASVPIPIVVGTVPTPTSITIFGGAVYVASYGGTVFRLALLPGGLLGQPEAFASGFGNPLGVAFAPDGTMFVADSHASSRPTRTVAGRVWAVAPGGARAVVVDELPNGLHNTNGLAVLNGRLYIANGNSTDNGISGGPPEEPLSGTLVSVPLGARNLPATDPGVVVEARGMRNLFDVAFRPGTTEAWIPTNGPDVLDPFGEDVLLKANVAGSAPTFGFPGCVYAANPTRVGSNPAIAGGCAAHTPPEQLMGLHASADGLAFGPQTGGWDGDLFVAEFGNAPGYGQGPAGHTVVRVPIDAAGRSGPPEDFLSSGAPLDVTFGPDGMYVADFGGSITLVLLAG